MTRGLGRRAVQFFPLGMLIMGAHAWSAPYVYQPLAPKIPWMLGVVMFGMGMTLRWDDFRPVFSMPRIVLLGVAAQFIVMPLVAYLLARSFHLPNELALGLILVGSCPGGTASNVMTYLARGDVAYSVTLTSCSTLLAPILTPLLTWWLCGTWVSVEVLPLFISTAKIIIVPLALGIAIHRLLIRWIHVLIEICPLISAFMIILIVAVIISLQHDHMAAWIGVGALAVILHNTVGLVLGYGLGRFAKLDTGKCRALTFEVGMQNSGLGVVLATLHFGGAAAIPAAIFSVWHNLSGSVLASFWVRRR